MGLHDAGLKDPQQRQHWIDGDGVERKRIIDFEAYTSVPYAEAEPTGEYVGHILRIIRRTRQYYQNIITIKGGDRARGSH
jgi:hypothetical protein